MSQFDDENHENYIKYRGKCKEYSEQLCNDDPTLTLVRGHYFCPFWGVDDPHWWCVKSDGTIVDPTKLQFPSRGNGIYTPFDGIIECSECGTEMKEEDAHIDGRYAYCSDGCAMAFVGLL